MNLDALFGQRPPPSRWKIFERAVELAGGTHLSVVETGVSTDYANGISTVFWATCPKVDEVVSIDLDPSGFDDTKRKLGISELPKVRAMIGHSITMISKLAQGTVDLLYLDSDADPELMLHEFLAALPKLKRQAVLVADDIDTKGPLLMDFLEGKRIPCKYPLYPGWRGRLNASIEVHAEKGVYTMAIAVLRSFDGFEVG